MRKVSKKQSKRNREVGKIKQSLSPFCVICGMPGADAAHLLPKSIYPEHYTNPENIVIMCRNCHRMYDDNLMFRRLQKKLILQVQSFDPQGAIKYFKL